MLRVDLHRLGGDGRGDGRIAVPVSANPAAEAKEGGHERRVASAAGRIQGAIEGPIDLGHRAKERLVENRSHRAHLVQRKQLRRPQLARPPQQVDLLEQPALALDTFVGGGGGIVDPIQLVADAPDRCHDRAPPRLGRMGGEDGVHLEAFDELLHAPAAKLP